ncbi:MAG: PAS domain-containing protein [Segetibacter sp.]|nr:PAS domain-containing protein [Segetibacter sp.]
MVRSINDVLIVVDIAGKILKVNNAFYSLFQINKETVEGLNLSDLNHNFLSSAQLKQNIEFVVKTGP